MLLAKPEGVSGESPVITSFGIKYGKTSSAVG